MPDTRHERLLRGARVPGTMRAIEVGAGEPITVDPAWRSLGCLVHLSDLHICDAQSPSRVEYFDRYADPDNPLAEVLGLVGVYRPQEMLTTQVLAAAVDAANAVTQGPSGAPVDAVVVTGDTVDNAQGNEMGWYTTILDGGTIVPTSGDPDRWEGVGGPDDPDERYWHPEGGADDLPRRLHGFPTIPGFFSVAQRPVTSAGLRRPWFAIHGNHDALLQGVTPPDDMVEGVTTGDRKFHGVSPDTDVLGLLMAFAPIGPATFPHLPDWPAHTVTADPARSFQHPGDYAAAHLACGHGHGFSTDNVQARTAYWTRNLNEHITLVALDTVNRHGGWHGSVDREQMRWLRGVLERADRYVVIMSHHPVETLVNGWAPEGVEPPALADEVRALLLEFPRVVLWLAGHTHKHEITYEGTSPECGFWHVRTSSLIDWPQQSRVVELLETPDGPAIATYVFDHAGDAQPDVAALERNDAVAGLSRWLSANNWQRQEGPHVLDVLEGTPQDRNAVLRLGRR